MPLCPKCGEEANPDARYCSHCGANLQKTATEQLTVMSEDLVRRVKELIHEGNVRRITVKDEEGRVLIDIPVTAGIVGIVIAPLLAALGVIAALATKCTIEVERKQDKKIN